MNSMTVQHRCAAPSSSTSLPARRFCAVRLRGEGMDKTSVMVCGHGSRDGDAIREFELVAAGIKARLPDYDIETGYLEFARPMIRDGLDALVSRGAKRILALPGMLFAATHVKNDLPWELNTFMA